ncbi:MULTISPECIES: hypothetical protein [Enterovibrio]|nr:hypothetical protein [Enterovibrio norvegicus]
MKEKHKTLLMTVVLSLVVIAMINNVSAFEQVKKQLNGDSSWF